jgi:hypothetical protein
METKSKSKTNNFAAREMWRYGRAGSSVNAQTIHHMSASSLPFLSTTSTLHRLARNSRLSILESRCAHNRLRTFEHQLNTAVLRPGELDVS